MADFEKAFKKWGRNPVFFAGRDGEMATLRRWVLEERQPLVAIVGKTGIGKTTLAYRFMNQYANRFPGGSWYLERPSEPPPPPSTEDSLVVLDEAHSLSADALKSLLNDASRQARRQYIMVFQQPRVDVLNVLTLQPLSPNDIVDIFRSLMLDVPRSDEELLATLSSGYPRIAQLLAVTVRDKGLSEGLKSLSDFFHTGIVDAQGRPVHSGTRPGTNITSGLVIANDEVIRRLAAEPELLHRLSSREFEDLVAELLNRQGYDVTLTPVSKDGGKDIYVAHKSGLGSALYVVECKKYSPDNPVGVGVVRALYGIVQAEQLTGGIVATTSYFTRGAQKFRQSVQYQMSLSDYHKVREWLATILGNPGGTT